MRVSTNRGFLGPAALAILQALWIQAANAGDAFPRIREYSTSEAGNFANACLDETERGVIAVDSILTNTDGMSRRAKSDALGKPLRAVLPTRRHPDHYNGVANLVAGEPIAMTGSRSRRS